MAGRDDIERLHDDLEQLFADFWRIPRFPGQRAGFRPQVDVYRTDDPPELTVVVDLAGVDPGDVEVAVHERALYVSGVRRRIQPECQVSYDQLEIEYGQFQRRIMLTEEVDAAGARAGYERGLLTIVLPVVAAAPREPTVSIRVRVSR